MTIIINNVGVLPSTNAGSEKLLIVLSGGLRGPLVVEVWIEASKSLNESKMVIQSVKLQRRPVKN